MIRKAWARLRDPSTDAALLTAVAVFAIGSGARYLPTADPEPPPHGLELVAQVFHSQGVLTLYASGWLFAAFAAVVGMAVPSLRRPAYLPAFVVALMSVAVYLFAWIGAARAHESTGSDYLNVTKYLFVVLVIRTRWYAMKKGMVL